MAETRLLTEPWHLLSEGQQLAALRCAYETGKKYAHEWRHRPPAEPEFYLDRCVSGSSAIVETAWKGLGDRLCEEPRVCRFVHGYEEERRQILIQEPIPGDLEMLHERFEEAKRRYELAVEERNRAVIAEAESDDRRLKRSRQLGEIAQVVKQVHSSIRQEYQLAQMLYQSARVLEEEREAGLVKLPRPKKAQPGKRREKPPHLVERKQKETTGQWMSRLSSDLQRKLEEVRPLTAGRRAVMVGGIDRPEHRQLLEQVFQFAELRWSEPGTTGNYFERCERDIRWAEIVFYLRYNRTGSKKTWHLCGPERPLISLADGGYGVSRVIEETHKQLLCKRIA